MGSSAVQGPPVAGPSIPVIQTMPSAAPAFSMLPGVPSIPIVNDSDSDPDVQSLTIPFRSGSSTSENYLPMITTEDSWITELEFRFVSLS